MTHFSTTSMLRRLSCLPSVRHFASSSVCNTQAIVYSDVGRAVDNLRVISYPPLPPPGRHHVNLKFLLSPVNPADINVIEGSYPSKPTRTTDLCQESVFVGGNEGLARVIEVGAGINHLKPNDYVLMTKPQAGTWAGSRSFGAEDVLKIENPTGLTDAQMATLSVNPPTAYNMLNDFVKLEEGDWVVQNGANSAVGQAVIQIAAARGIKTINFIRNRDNVDETLLKLVQLGATHVFTYDALHDKRFRNDVKALLESKTIRLGLNCVGGEDTTRMLYLLGEDAHIVTYGGMSKQPLALPTSSLIFKNLTAHGFWQSRWYANNLREARGEMLAQLTGWMREGKLQEPEHEIVDFTGLADGEATSLVREVMQRLNAGKVGKKLMLRFE